MFALRAAHFSFLVGLMPLPILSMNTSEKIIATPLCAPDETVWRATFAGDGQEIKPTVVLSKHFLFNIQGMQHVNTPAHLKGKNNPHKALSDAELVRMRRKAVRINSEDNCEHFLTDSHEITLPAYNTVGSVILKNLSDQKTRSIAPAQNSTPQKHTPWCAIDVAPEKPVIITTHDFLNNRKIHCVDYIANNVSTFCIPFHTSAQKRYGPILTITASPCSEQIRKIALATQEDEIINDKRVEQVFAHLINVTHSNSDKLELWVQENFPIKLGAGESLAGLGWTTNGEKLVVLRKPAIQGVRRIASSNLILETYSTMSGKRIACANMPIPSSGHLEAITELSNDHSLLITGNTLATTPRKFVLDNTLHDMKKQLPTKDLQRTSAHNIISLLRQRELSGSRISYHRAAAIEPVQQQ